MRGERNKRRQFIALAASAAAISFLQSMPIHAQSPDRRRRVGVQMPRDEGDAEGQKQLAALHRGLAELGWVEGQTLQIDSRWSVGDLAKAQAYARELIALKPDVLVAAGTPSLVALRQTTNTIPIVFVSVADPVSQGFVPSLARPGGNITGFGVEEASMGGKWLELLKEIAPAVARVVSIFNPDTAPYARMFLPTIEAAARSRTVALTFAPVRSGADIGLALATIGREINGGLVVLPDSFTFVQRDRIIALAAQHRLPAIYPIRLFATDGGLIAYGIDRVDLFRRAASYVDRILKGATPAELPVQQPSKFELAVNVKTAKALGLTVPQSLLLSADEVIE